MDDVTATALAADTAAALPSGEAILFQVDDLKVELGTRRVVRAGVDLKLPGLSFDLFVVLMRAAPNVVTVRRLMDLVWRDAVVSPETVSQRVKLLRSALGDDVKSPRYIAGVRNRGYRMVALVTELPTDEPREEIPRGTATPPIHATSLQARFIPSWGLLALTACGLAAFAYLVWPSRQSQSVVLPSRTVAVLPFETLGSHAPQDVALAASMAEEALHALADSPAIKVVPRRSSFALEGRKGDVTEIGRRLNAAYLLEGNVQTVGTAIRVRATFMDTAIAQNLWSLDFDRPSAGDSARPDRTAARLAELVAATLDASADERRQPASTSSAEAYLEYLQGRRLAASYRLADLQNAVEHYSRALEADPAYSRALSGLAWARYQMRAFRTSNTTEQDWSETQTEVREEIQKAMELDGRNADAWLALAAIESDPRRAELLDRRAIAIEPDSARAHFALSQVVFTQASHSAPQRMDEAISLIREAMRLDPQEPRYPTALAQIYTFQRTTEIDKAEPLLAQALQLDPEYFPALYALGTLRFCCQNRIAEGIKLSEQALHLDPTSTAVRSLLVHMYLDVGDLNAAEQLLSAGNQNQSSWIAIYAYRREWQKAAQIMYDDAARSNLAIPPDARYGFVAVLQDARDAATIRSAIALFEKTARVAWQTDGSPITGIPMSGDMIEDVGLGDLLMRAGDQRKSRRLLETALAQMRLAAVTYQRGTMWYTLQRARALAILGRNDEALDELTNFSRSGWAPDAWLLDVDVAFDGMRGDERFKNIIAERHANAARERAEVDALRSQKGTPENLRWR